MNRTNQQYPAQSRTSIRKLPSLHGMAVLIKKLLADCFVDKHKACSECSKQKKQLGIHVLTLTVTRASYVFSKVLDSILATLIVFVISLKCFISLFILYLFFTCAFGKSMHLPQRMLIEVPCPVNKFSSPAGSSRLKRKKNEHRKMEKKNQPIIL